MKNQPPIGSGPPLPPLNLTDCYKPLPKVSGWRDYFMCFLAGLADTAVYFVALVAIGIVVIYFKWHHGYIFFAGIGAAAFVWLAIALIRAPFAIPSRARADSFTAFLGRFRAVESKICALEQLPAECNDVLARTGALAEAEGYRKAIYEQLAEIDLRWVRGEGYVSLWESLNRAEEALFITDFADSAVEEGLKLELRLHKSPVPNADKLLVRLRQAVVDLDQGAARYLIEQPPARQDAPQTPISRGDALLALREVASTMNEYRAQRWAAIIRARNALLDIAVLLGLGLNALLGLVVLRGVDDKYVAVGALFYVVGVTSGWFHWWWVEQHADKLVDDFGLRAARLAATIVISGMAALFGVVVVQLWDDIKDFDITVPGVIETPTVMITPQPDTPVPTAGESPETPLPLATAVATNPALSGNTSPDAFVLVNSSVTEIPSPTPTVQATATLDAANVEAGSDSGMTPTITPTATPSGPGDGIERLHHTFDLDLNLVGLFVAAVFGFAPQVLVQILQRPTEKYKDDLQKTEVTDGN